MFYKFLASISLILFAQPAGAVSRAVMEGVAASRYTIKVDTANGRVEMSTTSYSGGIPNVGLYITSNVAIGTNVNRNACVIYATGSISCLGVNLSSTSPATFPAGVSGTINQSTFTLFNTDKAVNQTAMGPCIDGSTVSLTLANAAKVSATFSGGLAAEDTNDVAIIGFLVDGAFPTGTTSTLGLAFAWDQGAGAPARSHIGFRYLTRTTLAAGSHSFCLTSMGTSGGSHNLECDSAACNWEIEEFH